MPLMWNLGCIKICFLSFSFPLNLFSQDGCLDRLRILHHNFLLEPISNLWHQISITKKLINARKTATFKPSFDRSNETNSFLRQLQTTCIMYYKWLRIQWTTIRNNISSNLLIRSLTDYFLTTWEYSCKRSYYRKNQYFKTYSKNVRVLDFFVKRIIRLSSYWRKRAWFLLCSIIHLYSSWHILI